MKKYLPIAALSIALMGCANSNAPAGEDIKDNQIEEENKEDQKKVIEVSKPEKSEEESEDKISEENKSEDTDKSKKVDKDINDKEEDREEDKEETESKEEKPGEEENVDQENQAEVSADDLFFLPYSTFRSVNEDGEIVDENGIVSPSDDSYNYDYVKYSNNIFIRTKRNVKDLDDKVAVVRMNDKNVTSLYEFPSDEEFRPLGLVGDKIYGFHNYYAKSDINGTETLENEKNAIGYVDLASGEVHDFEDTIDVMTGGAVVIDGELQFTKPGDNKEDAYNYDLYKLDLSKGLDQKAELVEKDFDLQYLFGQKRFVDGKPVWKILRADNNNIYANDQKFPFLWAEAGHQEIIGNNIFYFQVDAKGEGETDRLSTNLKVINLTSGETVLEDTVRGIKIADGKLYYITKDNEVKSIEIEL